MHMVDSTMLLSLLFQIILGTPKNSHIAERNQLRGFLSVVISQICFRVLIELLRDIYPSTEVKESHYHQELTWGAFLSKQDDIRTFPFCWFACAFFLIWRCFTKDILDGSSPMELDAWIPSKSLGFEYQGEQHYHQFEHNQSLLIEQQQRDNLKHQSFQNAFVTLINVPYWWDQKQDSLKEIIKEG